MAESRLDSADEGTQSAYINFKGNLFTTAVKLTSTSPDGEEFSRKALGVRRLPRYRDGEESTGWYLEVVLMDGRIVEYPLKEYYDYSFDVETGTAAFSSRGQEFSITAIEDSEAPQAPREETGDITNE